MLPDAYQKHAAVMRERHGYCGPYRLGIAVGEAGENLPSPYTADRSTNSYEQGKKLGAKRRKIAAISAATAGVHGMSEAERVTAIRATTEYVSWFPIEPAARPCDQPGGCNASNCLGCGESSSGTPGVQKDGGGQP